MVHIVVLIFIYKAGFSPSQNRRSFTCDLTISGVDCSLLYILYIIFFIFLIFYGLIIKCCFPGRFHLL